MKFLRGLVVVLSLLIASCTGSGQEKSSPKGYDLGACSPDSFLAAHVLVVGKDLKMDLLSEEPGVVDKQENPLVYKFQSKDDKGNSEYLYESPKNRKLRLVLNFDKKQGIFFVDDKPAAVIFIMNDDDGSKLAENAMEEVKACIDLVSGSN